MTTTRTQSTAHYAFRTEAEAKAARRRLINRGIQVSLIGQDVDDLFKFDAYAKEA